MTRINKNFEVQRAELKLSQLDVAMLLNVSRASYNKWEQEPDLMPLGKYLELELTFERIKKMKEDK